MITDKNLRLSGTTSDGGLTWTAQSITGAAASDNVIDLSSDKFSSSDGNDIEVQFGVVTTATSSGTNVTLDIALYAVPVSNPSGGAGNIATVAYSTGSPIFTKAAHGLANGTRVTVGSAIGSSFATSTAYYVVNATDTTFNLAATPSGAAIGADATGSVTVTWYGEHLGSLIVPFERLIAGTSFVFRLSPNHPLAPVNRYLVAVYTPSSNLTAGSIFADVVYDFSDNRKYYPNGFTVV